MMALQINNVEKSEIYSPAISFNNLNSKHLEKRKNNLFVVANNEVLGRYLVAERDVKQGELILKELPFVVGPSLEANAACLSCCKYLTPTAKPLSCFKCGVAPLCRPLCPSTGHSTAECNYFKAHQTLTTDLIMANFQIVMPLRCLILRDTNPESWRSFLELEAHLDQRRNTPIWGNHKVKVENILAECGLLTEDDIKNELIQRICGALDVNAFELRVPGDVGCLRGIYLQAALMAHDCIGNTHLAVDDNFEMTLHASVFIPKGSLIYFNYTNVLQGLYDRQEHLKEGKYFNCSCQRCLDPTDCGTYINSLICVKCKGYASSKELTKNIYDYNTLWQCSSCNYIYGGSMVCSTVTYAKTLIEESDKMDYHSLESLLKKLQFSFAPNHFLLLDLKQILLGLYSETLQRESNPNRKLLYRKLELCKELLPVLEKLEPGISRLKGITLYEMHIPMVMLANKKYESKEISSDIYLEKLLESENVLKKAIACLIYEPNLSPEGRLTAKAMSELKFLRNMILNVQQIIKNKNVNVENRRKKK